jgi:hypothetical protein
MEAHRNLTAASVALGAEWMSAPVVAMPVVCLEAVGHQVVARPGEMSIKTTAELRLVEELRPMLEESPQMVDLWAATVVYPCFRTLEPCLDARGVS